MIVFVKQLTNDILRRGNFGREGKSALTLM
jgi:hypothetical protein